VTASETPNSYELPVLPLKSIVLFPHVAISISFSRASSLAAIEAALARDDKMAAVFAQRDAAVEEPGMDDLFSIGTSALIKEIGRSESSVQVILYGLQRVRLLELLQSSPFLKGLLRPEQVQTEVGVETEALQREVMELTKNYLTLGHPEVKLSFPTALGAEDDIMQLVYPLAHLLSPEPQKGQELLEAPSRTEAMKLISKYLAHENQILELRKKITSETAEELSREQRDYFLRQQLQTIRKELGEQNSSEAELTGLRKRFDEAGLPGEVKEEVERELERLAQIPMTSPEYQVARSHLDLVLELPWHQTTVDNLDIGNARQVLDEDHYGLAEVKERIIEQLAVMKLNPQAKSPILCFVGPPGVGKTSLGQSIARALARKFERFSLGGMHDEAELRGHRRTYIGAMPGRIIQAIRRAKVKNPLIMLDEIDKLGRDFHGDPSAALMEVLDPAQNLAFRDNYLDLPFDLSKVFFITTANSTDTVPKPLLDRMEVIELSGYSDEEKLEIASRYLLPRQRGEAGLGESQFVVPRDTLQTVIRRYTREAGVRELERMLGRLARKVAVRFAEEKGEPATIQRPELSDMLGPERFFMEETRHQLPPGVATGLAWTEAGGDVLYVEATLLPEGAKFTLTGHLGEIMKESAMTANSYVISHFEALGIEGIKAPVHIHVPAGAIPKDGPSAGITVAASLASLYSGLPTRSDTAMTGEITLSGLILPVGGIKEKILAARRAGIIRVIMPEENRKDLSKLPERIREEIECIFVSRIEEALNEAIPLLAQHGSHPVRTEEATPTGNRAQREAKPVLKKVAAGPDATPRHKH